MAESTRIYRHLYKEWKAWIHGEAREFSEQTCAFMDEERKQSRSLHIYANTYIEARVWQWA